MYNFNQNHSEIFNKASLGELISIKEVKKFSIRIPKPIFNDNLVIYETGLDMDKDFKGEPEKINRKDEFKM